MSLPRQVLHMLGKELLTEWRQRSRISGVFWFSFAVVLMVGFSTPSSKVLAQVAGGTLWVGLLLASTRVDPARLVGELEHFLQTGQPLFRVDVEHFRLRMFFQVTAIAEAFE